MGLLKNDTANKMISLFNHNKMDVRSIQKHFKKTYTLKQVANVIAVSQMEMEVERYITIESSINFY